MVASKGKITTMGDFDVACSQAWCMVLCNRSAIRSYRSDVSFDSRKARGLGEAYVGVADRVGGVGPGITSYVLPSLRTVLALPVELVPVVPVVYCAVLRWSDREGSALRAEPTEGRTGRKGTRA